MPTIFLVLIYLENCVHITRFFSTENRLRYFRSSLVRHVADKTGAGNDYGISNDIGIIWPPSCAPIVVTIYSVHNKKNTTRRDDVIASAKNLVINEFAQTDKCMKRKYD